MHIVGVDLAWGPRARTGLCVADLSGVVLDSASVRSDAEIADWLRSKAPLARVAFDAPLVVTNPTGMRPCERELSRRFGRFHAGCYPSNLTLLRGRVRAHDLAVGLGLTVGCNAIEVYPHAALVSFGRLERVLAYKSKRGRTLDGRRGELARLMRLVEAFDGFDVTRCSRWEWLAAVVASAGTGAGLDRAEDELDSYVCAYVGLLHFRDDPRVETIGDDREGQIVVLADTRAIAPDRLSQD